MSEHDVTVKNAEQAASRKLQIASGADARQVFREWVWSAVQTIDAANPENEGRHPFTVEVQEANGIFTSYKCCLILGKDGLDLEITDNSAYMGAGVDNEGLLYANLRTKNRQGKRVPFLSGKDFLKATVAYVENKGFKINGFESSWVEGGDNYTALEERIPGLSTFPAGEIHLTPQIEEAIRSTWTGRTLPDVFHCEPGELRIKSVSISSTLRTGLRYVTVTFLRNQHQSAEQRESPEDDLQLSGNPAAHTVLQAEVEGFEPS